MRIYGELCGWALARAHARSGDRIAIAAYLGGSDVFDQAISRVRRRLRRPERTRPPGSRQRRRLRTDHRRTRHVRSLTAGRGGGQCQEQEAMTAEPSESLVTEGVRSLEVRWIFPGQPEAAVTGWFGRFPAVAGITRGHLPPGSAVARAVGKGPRGRGTGGEGIPRQPGNPRGGRPRPGADGVLAEVVLFPSAPPPAQRSPRPAGYRWGGGASPVLAGHPGRSWRPPWGRARSRGARWNSPRSASAARTGGPWGSRRPAPPICSAAHSRPPPRSSSPTPCPGEESTRPG